MLWGDDDDDERSQTVGEFLYEKYIAEGLERLDVMNDDIDNEDYEVPEDDEVCRLHKFFGFHFVVTCSRHGRDTC